MAGKRCYSECGMKCEFKQGLEGRFHALLVR